MSYESWLAQQEAELERKGYHLHKLFSKQDLANMVEGDKWPFEFFPISALRPETWGPLRPHPDGTMEVNTVSTEENYQKIIDIYGDASNSRTDLDAMYQVLQHDIPMRIFPYHATQTNMRANGYDILRVDGALTSGAATYILHSPATGRKSVPYWMIMGCDYIANPTTTYFDVSIQMDTSGDVVTKFQARACDLPFTKIPLYYDHTVNTEDLLCLVDDHSGSSTIHMYFAVAVGDY